jgi:hypothetical protein
MSMNNTSKHEKTINHKKKRATRTIASFSLLASVLALSSFAAIQLAASNAYAQSSTRTVTGSCELFRDGNRLDLSFIVTGSEQDDTRYYEQLVDSSGTVLESDGTFLLGDSYTFAYTNPELGEQYTYNLYADVDDDYQTVGVEEDELVASDTVTCPSYTDLFRNQSQCVKYARAHPGGDITKSGCQEAF